MGLLRTGADVRVSTQIRQKPGQVSGNFSGPSQVLELVDHHRIRQLSRSCARRKRAKLLLRVHRREACGCTRVNAIKNSPENTSPLSEITADRGSPIAEVSVEDIKALADHVDAALLPSTASRKLPEWVAKLQDAVALNCCKGDASGERGAAQ